MTDSKQLLLSFCQKIISGIENHVPLNPTDVSEEEVVLALYAEKCERRIKSISDTAVFDENTKSEHLKDIAQLVMDITYVDECNLVESDFQDATSYSRIIHILHFLLDIFELASKVSTQEPVLTLGVEIVECIHWRKGALLYMYCSTLNNEQQDHFPDHYDKCLKQGIEYLDAMFSARSTPSWLADVNSPSQACAKGDAELLTMGVYSDIHQLALMYMGELCYWCSLLDKEQKQKQSVSSTCDTLNSLGIQEDSESKNVVNNCDSESNTHSFQEKDLLVIIEKGKKSLHSYIQAAKGALSVGGWSTTRAEEILDYFSHL